MSKYTTEQLKEAAIELYGKKDNDSFRAYQIAFDELEKRMGDDFDLWLDTFC